MYLQKHDPAALAGADGARNNHNNHESRPYQKHPQAHQAHTAQRLAEAGYAVYPVYANKTPACPHGFKDAVTNAVAVRNLFAAHPAPLIGVATGERSGIDALDLDLPRHTEAVEWYETHRHAFPATRTHRSRSGGIHMLFQHASGLRCSTGRPIIGIDVRADGGGIIWWPAFGCSILDHSQPAPWPEWLLAQVSPPRAIFVQAAEIGRISDAYVRCAVDRAANAVANARQGTRNATLNSEAWSLMRFVQTGTITAQEIATVMASAALTAGLNRSEVAATLASVLHARGIA